MSPQIMPSDTELRSNRADDVLALEEDTRLRNDIRLLGRILGDTVRDQEGADVFDLVERIRQTSIRFHRDDDKPARRELEILLDSMSTSQTVRIVRAFSYFSHLANIAEDQNNIRQMRARSAAGGTPRPGTLALTLSHARAAGFSAADLRRFFATALVSPVLTAHPTEVRRKSTIDREMEIAALLNRRERVQLTPEEIEAANREDPTESRKALETLLGKNPTNAMLMARLGASYRTVDPARSLDLYRRALEIEPHNVDYAIGYSSALVQARRFADAVGVLRKVISAAPDNYVAHANLATALYSLKQYPQALDEYEWLLKAKPDLTVTHYFIATTHDYLGEYEQALTAYELFLARADPKTNQLEIEKVKLRLPSLRRQIQLGQGVKRKPDPTRKP